MANQKTIYKKTLTPGEVLLALARYEAMLLPDEVIETSEIYLEYLKDRSVEMYITRLPDDTPKSS